MYQDFLLEDSRDVERVAGTRFYYMVTDPNQIDPRLKVSREGYEDNYVFTHANGTDAYYLLNSKHPAIGNWVKRIPTDIEIEDCFDIVFISNGEPLAAEHYARLEALGLPNRLVWCKDVDGRNEAYKTAARMSNTRYFFAVFAKIEIDPDFDFSFGIAPFDRHHYIFRVTNPVNGLEYGHQAVILYNREQVLLNPGDQLDFTIAQPFREIDRVCGVARYNTDPWTTWRTAFRETLKLLIWQDPTSIIRAGVWMTGQGEYADWSIKGAEDAMEFHATYNHDPLMLQKSYNWKWLREQFESKTIP